MRPGPQRACYTRGMAKGWASGGQPGSQGPSNIDSARDRRRSTQEEARLGLQERRPSSEPQGQAHFFLARSAASRAAMLRAAVTRWMTLMTDLSKAMGAVIQRPAWKSPTDPTTGPSEKLNR